MVNMDDLVLMEFFIFIENSNGVFYIIVNYFFLRVMNFLNIFKNPNVFLKNKKKIVFIYY